MITATQILHRRFPLKLEKDTVEEMLDAYFKSVLAILFEKCPDLIMPQICEPLAGPWGRIW